MSYRRDARHTHTGSTQEADDAVNEHERHLSAKPVMFVKSNTRLHVLKRETQQ